MKIDIRRADLSLQVRNTPEALFEAAAVLALAGLILAIMQKK